VKTVSSKVVRHSLA